MRPEMRNVKLLVVVSCGPLLLAACGGASAHQVDPGSVAAPNAKRSTPSSSPKPLPFRVRLEKGQKHVLERWGVGPITLPDLPLGSYRMLIACSGDPLKVLDGTKQITKTLCDSVTLDAKAISDPSVKKLKINASKTTHWHVMVATMRDPPG